MRTKSVSFLVLFSTNGKILTRQSVYGLEQSRNLGVSRAMHHFAGWPPGFSQQQFVYVQHGQANWDMMGYANRSYPSSVDSFESKHLPSLYTFSRAPLTTISTQIKSCNRTQQLLAAMSPRTIQDCTSTNNVSLSSMSGAFTDPRYHTRAARTSTTTTRCPDKVCSLSHGNSVGAQADVDMSSPSRTIWHHPARMEPGRRRHFLDACQQNDVLAYASTWTPSRTPVARTHAHAERQSTRWLSTSEGSQHRTSAAMGTCSRLHEATTR